MRAFLFKICTKPNLLSSVFLLDSLLTLIQGLLTENRLLIYASIIVACSHALIALIENLIGVSCAHWHLFATSLKGILQLALGTVMQSFWLAFATFQLLCLIRQDQTLARLHCTLFFAASVVAFSLTHPDSIIVAVLRALINFILASQLFQTSKQPHISLKFIQQILNSQSTNIISLLDQNFQVIFETPQFTSILNEQVSNITDHINSSVHRIVTPRDQPSKKLSPNDDEECFSNRRTLSYFLTQLALDCKSTKMDASYIYQLADKQEIMLLRVEDFKPYYVVVRNFKVETTSEFASVVRSLHKVSHDMRTPLNAIINMQNCLQDYLEPALCQKYLKPSLNSCKLLLNLLNDILDSAQWGNKKIRLANRRFNMMKMIEKTLLIFEIQIETKEMMVSYHYDSKLSKHLYSDKFRVRQILINLLSNALKYTPAKGQIFINCEPYRDNRHWVLISVRDSGVGIKEENLQKLFGDFNKIDDLENRVLNPNGVGLGLQISNELAKLLGPKERIYGILVESTYGQGSTFSFVVENHKSPVEDLSESSEDGEFILQSKISQHCKFIATESGNVRSPTISQVIPRQESSKRIMSTQLLQTRTYKPSQFNMAGLGMTNSMHYQGNTHKFKTLDLEKMPLKKAVTLQQLEELAKKWLESSNGYPPILIVDDNEFNIIVLQYMLDSFGMPSDQSMSGIGAYTKVVERGKQQTQFELIFLDMSMPVLDGLETARKMLDYDSTLKIFICTAFQVTQAQLLEYKKIGLLGAIEKPVKKQHLKEILSSLGESYNRERSKESNVSHFF